MEPRIVQREAFRIMGIQVRGNPMQVDYGDLWENQYMPRMDEITALGYGEECYGAYFETGEPNTNDILAAKAVAPDVVPPEGLVARDIPAATYAVFDCQIQSIGLTWQAIFFQWLPSSGYTVDPGKVPFEMYPPTETDDHSLAPVRIWVPICEGRFR